jgi:hypothetical protein
MQDFVEKLTRGKPASSDQLIEELGAHANS